MSLLDRALDLAVQGLPVFPVGENKRPTTKAGFYDASTDPATVARMFANPLARHVAFPTGAVSGIDVLDIDPLGADWMREHADKLGETRTHRTRRNGFHRLYRHREGVRCSEGVIALGIDIRGTGGYAVYWPASGLEVFRDGTPEEMPDWLYETIQAASQRKATANVDGTYARPDPIVLGSDDAGSFAERALARLRSAQDGEKHAALRSAALALGGVAHALDWSEDDAVNRLLDALPDSVADWDLARQTAEWGVAHGAAQPITVSDRAAPEFGDPIPDEEPEPEIGPGAAVRLGALLSESHWRDMDIPPPDKLLGDVLTTTTRAFLVGRTGLGKTLLGLGVAYGVASGQGFLRWPSSRPAKVLYIDGEMPAELIKPRANDALRRCGVPVPEGNLLIFGRDIETQARRAAPELPPFSPLNTDDGRRFLFALIKAAGKPDLIILDNVMSLITGDQKDEVPWSETVPLIQALSDRGIGQLWLDHTGHNSDRQYGSSTKAWRFDVSMVIAPIKDAAPDPKEVAFTLTFDKARRRTPDNWQQFEPQTIRLAGDVWHSEGVSAAPVASSGGEKVTPQARACYDVLAVLAQDTGIVGRLVWQRDSIRQGLVSSDATFRALLSRLKVSGWIEVDGPDVRPVKGFK